MKTLITKTGLLLLVVSVSLLGGCAQDISYGIYAKAVALEEEGKFDEAINEATRLIKENPQDAMAYVYRGRFYVQKGYPDEALENYEKALKINPQLGEGYHARARLNYARFLYSRAWEDLNKAKELGAKIDPVFLDRLKKESNREG